MGGLQPARGQGRRRDRRVGALAQAPVEQRQDRHERPVVPRHQPDLRRRRAPEGPQGDLPAGAGGRRLPRRRRLRRTGRRRLHPALARPGDRHRRHPAGGHRDRPAVGLRRAGRPPRRGGDLHPAAAARRGDRRRLGVRREVLPRPLAVAGDQPGAGADVPGRRGVRHLPARHPAALREPPEARRPHQDDHRPVGPPRGLVGRRHRQGRPRHARRAAAALVRPLRPRRQGPEARQGHPADHLLRAGQRPLDQGAALDGQPARRVLPALRRGRRPAAATGC